MTALFVMGVTGSGKTTVARAVADELGWVFLDGDDLHPASNIEKLTAGIALTDADRSPWLAEVVAAVDRHAATGDSCVVAISALRRGYRDTLRSTRGEARFAHLVLSPAEAERRVVQRTGHFMNPALVESQFATLEPLAPDEPGAEFAATETLARLVARITAWLGEGPG